jgi:hypothetical protein
MKLSDRWAYIKAFRRKWMAHPGVQMVKVGYEQYGMLNDIEVLEETMQREQEHFEIIEVQGIRPPTEPEAGSPSGSSGRAGGLGRVLNASQRPECRLSRADRKTFARSELYRF